MPQKESCNQKRSVLAFSIVKGTNIIHVGKAQIPSAFGKESS